MTDKHFNLLTEPWLKVIDLKGQEKEVSLVTLFKNASSYARLAGEMQTQDLAILRLLLAILTTVYSRFNAQNENYDWLETDPVTFLITGNPVKYDYKAHGEKEFLDTWKTLFEQGCFSRVLFDYLEAYSDRFDFFNETRPFYQVNKEAYNSLVSDKKRIKINPDEVDIDEDKIPGTVAVKQIDRTISESGNSPDVFSPKDELNKNKLSLSELIRWVITYQGFAGVPDKTKVKSKTKFSGFRGWLYSINPFFLKGNNLFETLMLNLSFNKKNAIEQKPVWEYDSPISYVKHLTLYRRPRSITEVYTNWSRIIHLEWQGNKPLIFVAKLPGIEVTSPFIEPMTTWTCDKNGKEYHPQQRSTSSLSSSMWRHFGQYIGIDLGSSNGSDYMPGEIRWLSSLRKKGLVKTNQLLNIQNVCMLYDNNDTNSQMPAAQISENMQIRAGVLFDDNSDKQEYWPARIQDAINLANSIGDEVHSLGLHIGNLRNPNTAQKVGQHIQGHFFDQLNYPFYSWLANLKNDDDRDKKIIDWKRAVKTIALNLSDDLLQNASPKEIRGIRDKDQIKNIFTFCRSFRVSVFKKLG